MVNENTKIYKTQVIFEIPQEDIDNLRAKLGRIADLCEEVEEDLRLILRG